MIVTRHERRSHAMEGVILWKSWVHIGKVAKQSARSHSLFRDGGVVQWLGAVI